MRYLPPQGLNVPTITVVDEGSCVIEADQTRSGRSTAASPYDNPEISAPGRAPHLRTAVLEELSRLPWVAGIKVSAPPRVLGEYTKAVLSPYAGKRI